MGWSARLDQYWSESFLSEYSKQIEITKSEWDHLRPLESVPDYPYKNQRRLTGTIRYQMDGWRDSEVPPKELEFEYRSSSGLFLLNISSDRPKPDKVINQLNEAISEKGRIKKRISFNREFLWDFITGAHEVQKIILTGPNGEINLPYEEQDEKTAKPDGDGSNFLDWMISIQPFSTAEHLSTEEPEIPKPPIEEISEKIDRYSIKYANVSFLRNGKPVPIEYKQGKIGVLGGSKRDREFIVERFERDVIYQSYRE